MLWLQLLVYLAVIVFVVATAARIWKYASAPVHLRWELYPVTADRDKPYGTRTTETSGMPPTRFTWASTSWWDSSASSSSGA